MTDVLALDIATITGWARGHVGDEQPRCGSIRFGNRDASQQMICTHAGEWFIEQQDFGAIDNRPRQRHPLLLPTG